MWLNDPLLQQLEAQGLETVFILPLAFSPSVHRLYWYGTPGFVDFLTHKTVDYFDRLPTELALLSIMPMPIVK